MSLLDEKPYSKISISDIIEKAGVARTSFYRNYASKDDVFMQYLDTLFSGVIRKMKESCRQTPVETLTIPFSVLIEHYKIIEKLLQNDLEYLLLSFADNYEVILLNIYQDTLPQEENLIFQYSIKYQAGGIIRLITHWLKNNMPLSPEQMGSIVADFVNPFKAQNRSITDLLVQIKN
ncbi:MAG: TetR/AcrR family transcriptional regulator [Treponema sp.]|nr:TetR/AcrR family transcriptional regulator [Treponema sp.]